MSSYSPYSINEADPPQWRQGEDIATGSFIGITLYLFVEVNVLIFRAFKRRRGLYFWSMQIGTLGILVETVGIILKYFTLPSNNAIWPLYTLFLAIGWAVYCTAQSLVLYSRLHLVMRNPRIQRYVLYMIVSTVLIFVVPHLVLMWPAYNTSDHEMSSLWSPREAIVQRYTQIGYTITESTISGLYIWSLVRLLRLKSNVRQQRVMSDLIYVNLVVIAFDILEVSFVYTNQLGISQPVQSFSYILKLRLEFVVLNQLMDVAARGMRRETFGKDRYFTPPADKDLSRDPTAHTKSTTSMPLSDSIAHPEKVYQIRPSNGSASDDHTSRPESEPGLSSYDHVGIVDQSSEGNQSTQTPKLDAGFFGKLPRAFKVFNHWSSDRTKDSKLLAVGQGEHSHHKDPDDQEDDEEAIELQLWERRGTAVVNIPWFRSKVEA